MDRKAVQIIARDITLRKQMEEEIKSSEIKFKTLFEYAPDAYFICDFKGNLIDGNLNLEEICGYSKNELINKNLLKSNFLPADQILKAAKLFFKNTTGHSAGPEEFLLIQKNGNQIPIEIRTFPIRIKSRALILGIARDITERKKAEKALIMSEERFRRLSSATFEGIIISTKDRILDTNLSMAEMLEYELQDMLGKSILDFVDEQSRNIVLKNIELGEEKIFEAFALKKDKSTFPIEIICKPTPHEDDLITITAIRNISERKRIERLREDTERIVRHDIKNPLHAIIGFSELLLELSANENQRKWITNIHESGNQVLRMINHSLDIFKMEEGTYLITPSTFDLISLFKKLNDEFLTFLKMKSININFFLNENPLSWDQKHYILGEHVHLESLFANLIKNAIEASPNNKSITISIYEKDTHKIDIHNFGVIPENIQDRFFERYVTAGKEGGTGLGTYTALIIAKAHNGNITFTTSELDGTHLIVDLPKVNTRKPINDIIF